MSISTCTWTSHCRSRDEGLRRQQRRRGRDQPEERVLAFVSQPGYDPNLFVEGISTKNYDALQKDETARSTTVRCTASGTPPGSTVKPFMGLATGTWRRSSSTAACTAAGFLPAARQRIDTGLEKDRSWHRWTRLGDRAVVRRVFSTSSPTNSVSTGSTVFFHSRIRRAHRHRPDRESTGLLPSREWKRRARNQPWYRARP